jgi:putative transposase
VRSSVQYIGVRPPQTALRQRIREIAEVRVSYGYRRITVLLRREGWRVNAKRTYRLYKEEGLGLRRKRPKRRRSAMARQVRATATRPNERWSMDFMSDALASGRRYRIFNALDVWSRECLASEWHCPSFPDTELGWMMNSEVSDGKAGFQSGVQARGGAAGS